ncbi:excisionase [Amycolatopsis sp. WAC 01416]|uniref:helix-turn-helix transcriptional regulator n=1 Tax=Amycolatopsis sp. WAC 01416 TaxID=2203196 RepID=UPI000F788B91|nr:helix-turn-helix domain-containing protein [Amycolatopsis sp. WAC 01416]RSN27500.1 excisionase [Amycolatopsis sp. WAC 01416]
MDPLLTIDEVAGILRVPTETLRTWRKLGKGPAGIRVGKYVRYFPDDVSGWLDAQKGI